MRIQRKKQSFEIGPYHVTLSRTAHGVMRIAGQDEFSIAAGIGLAHGIDRMLQMSLVRLIGQGRLSECLAADDESLEVDYFSRELGFARSAEADLPQLEPEVLHWLEAYAAGVNYGLAEHGYPNEFRLMGYRLDPWRPVDSLLTSALTTYAGLAQTQADAELFIIQAIHAGADLGKLKSLFAPHLDGLTPELVDLIRQTELHQPLLPKAALFHRVVPPPIASNNWVVAGRKSQSGSTLAAFDPHLEINRLPAVWYESTQVLPEDFRSGISMPGVPGMVMGRSRHYAAGLTYGFMDMVDHYIEEVRDGKVRRGDVFEPLRVRDELIRRKGKPSIKHRVWESRHGVIDLARQADKPEDGYCFSRAWACAEAGSACSMNALYRSMSAKSVLELQDIVCESAISSNWLIADRDGHIGYQQSGRLPIREHSGLHPVPGWDERFDWRGFFPGRDLARVTDPDEGYLATANDEKHAVGTQLSVNLPMGPYRADRIRGELAKDDEWTIVKMKRLQSDLYSLQAERFMPLIRPHLSSGPIGDLMLGWDLRYNADARAPTLFEAIYTELLHLVFGLGFLGSEFWNEVVGETCIMTDFYGFFDRVLLGDEELWFEKRAREEVFADVVRRVTSRYPTVDRVPTWGEERQIMMTHLLLGGRVPRFFGYDVGPIVLEGNRATVVQGVIYRAHGRLSTFAPSYRSVMELADDAIHTSLPGGPSDRRFSRWYRNDLDRFLRYEYKILRGSDPPQ